jgi:acylphosphatase
MPTIHLLIKGKVQGVSYRFTAKGTADKLSLTGWVKNTAEGHVEVMATGDEQSLQTFIAWCRKGPPGAKVTDVLINSLHETSFRQFTITRS